MLLMLTNLCEIKTEITAKIRKIFLETKKKVFPISQNVK